VHPLLLDELAAARVDELRRRAALPRPRPAPFAGLGWRSVHALGFLLVRAGLRLAAAGRCVA
jgi:hypothetical protein